MFFIKYQTYTHLFFIAALFMVVFQLVTRLTAYTFMFHQGVLLLAAALIGAGLSIIFLQSISDTYRTHIEGMLPILLLCTWLMYIVVFFFTQNLLVHFVVLSCLFGVFFLRITRMLTLVPNHFTATELAGSFVGVAGVVWASHFVLEEYILLLVTGLLFLYLIITYEHSRFWGVHVTILALFTMVVTYPLTVQTLPDLVTCPDTQNTYKVACLITDETFTHVQSIPNIKGRSDVFLNTEQTIPRLSVYNSGLHSGTTLAWDQYQNQPYAYHDIEIPALAYKTGSSVVTAGASTGSNIRTFQKYITDADITAVDIDTIITDLYTVDAYQEFLPIPQSYDFVFQDARTFFTTNTTSYDVVSMMVESVNTTLVPYVDESTSLVYTTQALQTYVEALAPNGYLILQQFHVAGDAGDAMIHKVLASLEQALPSASAEHMADNLLLYSSRSGPDQGAQRFLGAVYKPDGFTDEDQQIFASWLQAVNTPVQETETTNVPVTVLHTPDGMVQYDSFFESEQRSALATSYNTSAITDDKPFRHLVTTLPFPILYYIFMGAVLVLIFALVHVGRSKRNGPAMQYIVTAFVLGLLTFGLQYVLYYETAAFLGMNLIFFSVFLLIPLLFGALGGYLSLLLQPATMSLVVGSSVLAGFFILHNSVFSISPLVVFLLISILFLFSGMLFPLLLSRVTGRDNRSMLYALNMCGGGCAAITVVSLHALIGWWYLFLGISILLLLCFGILYGLFVRAM